MRYSTTSNHLLAVTTLVVGGSMMINPYLILGLSHTLMTATEASGIFLIALLLGSAAAYLLATRVSPADMPKCLLLTMAGLAMAMFGLASVAAFPREVAVTLAAGCLIAYRFSNAASMVLSRYLHVATNSEASDIAPLFARVGAVTGIATAIGPAIGGFVLETSGFESLALITGAVFACALLPLIQVCRTTQSNLHTGSRSCDSIGNAAPSSSDMIGALLTWGLIGQSFSFVPLLLGGRMHSSWIPEFFTWKALIIAGASGPVLGLLRRFSPLSDEVHLGGSIVLITVSLMLLATGADDRSNFMLVITLFGLGESVFQPLLIERVRLRVGPAYAAGAISRISLMSLALGAGVGQYVGTLAFEALPPKLTAMFFMACGIAATLCFILAPARRTAPIKKASS